MALKKRKYNIPPLKLAFQHEFIEIRRDVAGARNEFGEPAITVSTISTNTKADIQPVQALSTQQLKMFNQGLVEVSTHWMLVETDVDIKARDTVVDVDSNSYDVE